jgi:hypothetical protein
MSTFNRPFRARAFVLPLVLAVALAALPGTSAPVVAAGEDVTTTTLTITPADQQYAGGLVTFDIAVTAGSGSIPDGFVAIQTGGSCGTGSPLRTGTLDAEGKASFQVTFDTPAEWIFAACYFAPADSTFQDSETEYQPYSIVDNVTTPTLTITPADQQYVGGTVTFDVAVTAASGTIPQGNVSIAIGGSCGVGSPLTSGVLDAEGKASFQETFDEPSDWIFAVCYSAAEGSTFQDSETEYQPYKILEDVIITTLTITPADQQQVGGLVTFDIGVTAGSGSIPDGFVAVQNAGPCGTGSPDVTGTLEADGTATLTKTYTAPYDYVFFACYFAPVDSRFSDSQSDYVPYSIVEETTSSSTTTSSTTTDTSSTTTSSTTTSTVTETTTVDTSSTTATSTTTNASTTSETSSTADSSTSETSSTTSGGDSSASSASTTTTTSFAASVSDQTTGPQTDTLGEPRNSRTSNLPWLLLAALGVLAGSLIVATPTNRRREHEAAEEIAG